MVRVRVGPDERDAALKNATVRDGSNCRVSIPQDPGQAGLTQVKYLIRQLSGYSVKATPETGNKVVRCEPFASQVNVGNVLMLKADWNTALVSEMRMFPNGTFDDQVDALSRAFGALLESSQVQIIWPDGSGYLGGRQMALSNLMRGLPSAVLQAMIEPETLDVCGRCSSLDRDCGYCRQRNLYVVAKDPACPIFVAGCP